MIDDVLLDEEEPLEEAVAADALIVHPANIANARVPAKAFLSFKISMLSSETCAVPFMVEKKARTQKANLYEYIIAYKKR